MLVWITGHYLSLSDLPNVIEIDNVRIGIERKDSRLTELSVDSCSFLRPDANTNGRILVAGGFGTFLLEMTLFTCSILSRDIQGLPHPSGISEAYIKHFYLSHFENVTLYNVIVNNSVKRELRDHLQNGKKNSPKRKLRLSRAQEKRM